MTQRFWHYSIPAFGVFAVMVILSCTGKKNLTTESRPGFDLTGTWELSEAQNGMMPTATYEAGNGNYYVFTDTTFAHYNNSNLAQKGRYQLVADTTASATVGLELPQGEFPYRIIFSNNTTEKTFVGRRGNQLFLISGYFPTDGGSRQTFVKKENNP